MAKPTDLSPHLRWATAPLIPGDVVEPDVTHKDEGWQNAEEPPHTLFNYWMKLVYLWIVYLDNLTAEALTWTAAHVFNAGVTITTAAAQAALTVTGASGQDASLFKVIGTGSSIAAVHARAMYADGARSSSVGLLAEADGHGDGTGAYSAIYASCTGKANGVYVVGDGGDTDGSGVIVGEQFNNSNITDNTASAAVNGLTFCTATTSWHAGIKGWTQNGGELSGVLGVAAGINSGSVNGGRGGRFVGGNQAGAASAGAGLISTGGNGTGVSTAAAGLGATLTGGDITNGAGNAAGAGGIGARVKGGDITGDTHGRVGGAALDVTAGLGQAGYGPALHADHGGITLDEGNIIADNNLAPHVFGFMQIDGTLDVVGAITADSSLSVTGATVTNGSLTANGAVVANSSATVNGALTANAALNANAAMNVAGLLSANGGIALEAVTPLTITAPFTAGAQVPGVWKDTLGIVGCQGGITINTAVSLNPAFTLPGGYRPLQQCVFELPGDGSANKNPATAIVHPTGVVNLRFGAVGGFVGDIFIDAIRFRTTA